MSETFKAVFPDELKCGGSRRKAPNWCKTDGLRASGRQTFHCLATASSSTCTASKCTGYANLKTQIKASLQMPVRVKTRGLRDVRTTHSRYSPTVVRRRPRSRARRTPRACAQPNTCPSIAAGARPASARCASAGAGSAPHPSSSPGDPRSSFLTWSHPRGLMRRRPGGPP
jgi:hypothetical protein